MSEPTRWRKKPVVIEAMRWNGVDVSATPIIDWVIDGGGTARLVCDFPSDCDGTADIHHLVIDTLEGSMRAERGDWIICGVQGEFYPIKDAIFRETYEPVEES